ncbi:hypothetical protein GGF46_004297, partial [Coemansia sp. RSA 552]
MRPFTILIPVCVLASAMAAVIQPNIDKRQGSEIYEPSFIDRATNYLENVYNRAFPEQMGVVPKWGLGVANGPTGNKLAAKKVAEAIQLFPVNGWGPVLALSALMAYNSKQWTVNMDFTNPGRGTRMMMDYKL